MIYFIQLNVELADSLQGAGYMKLKSIQTKIVLVITAIMIIVIFAFGFTSLRRTNEVLDADSDKILSLMADQSYRDLESMLNSVEQSVDTIYNYAEKRAESYGNFLTDDAERERFTYDVSELGKSIAEKTPGAVSVYLRYNPEKYDPKDGFWYTLNVKEKAWNSAEPTDISMYDREDVEHVGWYYIPVETGRPLWMNPYYNKNMGIDMISYIIPYRHDGTVVGVIGMDIDIKYLRDTVRSIRIYESGRAYLVSSQGDIIFHFDHPDGVRSTELTDELMPFIKSVQEADINNVHTIVGIDNVKRKLISKRLRNGMILGLDTPVDEINTPSITLTRQLLLISVIIFVMAIVICLVWIRTIIASLKRMTRAAEHYANGDYSDAMDTNRDDEIGILSRSLQTMSNSLKSQIEIADTANRSKSTFLANMSHEIRTPINAILGFDEMILRETEEESVRSYAVNIKNSGRTLLTLINDILDFSKIESGKMEIVPVEYDPVLLINDMLDMVEFRAGEKGLKVNCNIDRGIPSRLYGDDIRIKEVLTNLLTNAVKYTSEGSITLTVNRLSYDASSVRLHFSVSDTGMGIKDEDREHLWDSFSRLDMAQNRGIEGTGLGLPITRKYIELMGGTLNIDSSYGQGSDFYFDLEQGIRNITPIGDFEQARRTVRERVDVYSEGFEAPEADVLIVDDIDLNLAVFKGLLKNSGMRIDTATSGPEAIAKMHEKEYDIVFMDHMMPGMDGIEALERIREDKDILSRDVPVIALTANAISGAGQKYMEAGFADYLSKPIDADILEKQLLKFIPQEKIISKKLKEGRMGEDTVKNESVSAESEAKVRKTIDRDKGLACCDGREEVYRIAAEMFVEDDYEAGLSRAYEDGNWKDYRTRVHGVKSSAQIVGATELHELALRAETSLKEQAEKSGGVESETDFVKDNHAEIIKLLREATAELKEYLDA
ncbi:MAG: response regulator [Lachnospiraceae bacterium]|nr:response regulator [Lachnospiraceae bacterium]